MTDETLIGQLRSAIASGDKTQPIYRQLIAAIEHAIVEGEVKRGTLLPSERVLSNTLSISRVTVRKALDGLVAAGLVRRRQGSRTEVTSRVEKSLAMLSSFSEDMVSRGFSPGCLWISKELGHPSPTEMMALGLAATAAISRLKRIRTADGMPIAIETAVVPARILPDPSIVGDSLYKILAERGALPQRALQRMQAGLATPSDAELLGINPNDSLLIVERRCFLGDGQIVEFTQTRYRGDVYDFVLELER